MLFLEWDRKVKKLKQVEDMDEGSIPEFFLRTAMRKWGSRETNSI